MRDAIWRWIAFVITHTSIAERIIASRNRLTPYFNLDGYMERWWWMPSFLLTFDKQIAAYRPWAWLPFRIRLHHILQADADAVLHDHPFNWRTIVLRGFYIEEDVTGKEYVRLAGDTRAATCETFHRINRVSTRGVWTLFFMSKKHQEWGFMAGDPPRRIHWVTYESKNKRIPGQEALLARLSTDDTQ